MRILFVINMLSTGGAERVASRLCTYWAEEHEVIVFLTSFSTQVDYPLPSNVRIINPSSKKRASRLKVIREIRKAILSFHIDVVVSFLDSGHFYTAVACLGLKVKHICSERNDPYNSPNRLYLRMMRLFAFKRCDAIVFQTTGARDFFKPSIRKKGFIISNPIVAASSPSSNNGQKREKIIIAVGRLEKQKNYPLLIRAFSSFLNAFPNYVLNIYGRGSEEGKLRRLIEELGLAGKVNLCGFSHNISLEYSKSSFLVMSSLHEGLPNALLEAICSGLPSISTDANPGGPRAIIEKCSGSILVQSYEVSDLAAAMSKMASNLETYYSLARNDSQQLQLDCSIDKIGDEWISLFNKLLSLRPNHE